MNAGRKALLLLGSAKGQQSTSASLGGYLSEKLRTHGYESESIMAHKAIKTPQGRQALIRAVDSAGLIILAFPLYVDCLPYPMIRTLEIIAAHYREKKNILDKELVAIVNCGFPESHNNDVAIAICRQFARQTGFTWAGGLGLGGGEAIDGRPLEKIRGLARNVIKSLDMTAEALAQASPIPAKAVSLMAKPMVPNLLYRIIGTLSFKRSARRFGTSKKLYRRPFHTPDDTPSDTLDDTLND